ncbi:serine-repeat antigen (SERA) [Plasmodium ovale curtisi]|uniref:Serine-repeat antigen (SERA) n=1 Tax=Plasmodium ovale curtisi TaxID=864141 RepID=A0A1A8VQ94_PLAOA|nr:serine-repeat antigen (SERA) [Plasmodium ovale curtisi]
MRSNTGIRRACIDEDEIFAFPALTPFQTIGVVFSKHVIIRAEDKPNEVPFYKPGEGNVDPPPASSENKKNTPSDTSSNENFPTKTISFTMPDTPGSEHPKEEPKEESKKEPKEESKKEPKEEPKGDPKVVPPLAQTVEGTPAQGGSKESGMEPTSEAAKEVVSISKGELPPVSEIAPPQTQQPPSNVVMPLTKGGSAGLGSNTSKSGLSEKSTEVESFLLKNYKGVKVSGLCGAYFRVYFVPHILIYALTKHSILQIESLFDDNTRIDFEYAEDIVHKCAEGKTFKLVAYIKDDMLMLKWKVSPPPPDTPANMKADVRKFRIPQLDRPFTSIQVYKANVKEGIIESKNYVIASEIPEKCSAIATNCFLNGNLNIENCYQCTLLVQNSDTSSECFNYVSSDMKAKFNDIKTKAQDEENSKENELTESIDIILKNIYKMDEKKKKKVLITIDDFDDVLKAELTNYCKLLKEMDSKGTLESYELGNEIDIFNNVIRMLSMHPKESIITLQDKLRNTAICIKNVDEWVQNKRGLVLPESTHASKLENPSNISIMDENEDEEYQDDKHLNDDIYRNDEDGVVDLAKAGKEIKLRSPYFKSSKYCNYEYCDRWKDKTSCISNIEVEEQGNCGLCWVFASKLHLETIRCMRGYGHFRSSALYVANCSKRKPEDRCAIGSNPIEFLQILDEQKFLPLESELPYFYKNAVNECPKPKDKWTNLWGNTKLLFDKMYGHFMSYKGFISYETLQFRDNMNLFVDIVKREVQNKGSVIIYIKTKDVIGYDFNGRIIHNMCGDSLPDHGANIVGYGNYINTAGEKRSYWLIRNSWGYYWGNEGTFKVDMLGPKHCKYNFIHTAVVFKMNLGAVNVSNKKDVTNAYFPKHNADFFHSLYFNNYNDMHEALPFDNYYSEGSGTGKSKYSRKKRSYGSKWGTTWEHKKGSVYGQDEPTDGNRNGAKNYSVEKNIQIMHILKHIEKAKITKGLVKYDNINETKNDHTCVRSNSKDPDRYEECKLFCEENWNACKKHYSPGYCLTKLYNGANCFFCYV